jgi:hypothetical protein
MVWFFLDIDTILKAFLDHENIYLQTEGAF